MPHTHTQAAKTFIAQSFQSKLASTQAACLSIFLGKYVIPLLHLCEGPDEGRTTDRIDIYLHGKESSTNDLRLPPKVLLRQGTLVCTSEISFLKCCMLEISKMSLASVSMEPVM